MFLCLVLCGGLNSCKDYLDIKPDKKMELPSTFSDCQALLDNYNVMSAGYPMSESSTDNYYLNFADWQAQAPLDKDGYIWKADADVPATLWSGTYQKILYANQVLETIGKIVPAENEQATWNQIKGAALFFRSFNFYQAAQLWTKPYDAATAATDPGIPLRLTPDISEKTFRATLKQTYDRILGDLHEAVTLLPATLPASTISKSRPGQVAAYALLSRVYLSMNNYDSALTNADKCLTSYNTLINYNTIPTPAAEFPFPGYNPEVIFSANSGYTPVLGPLVAKVDTVLYQSYHDNDLRKIFFFKENSEVNTYQFRGTYNGFPSYAPFCGLATDEVYLTRAECFARAGNTNDAMSDLNTLLRARWKTGTYTDMIATSAEDALMKILQERRKELLFRGLRWTDLRRLNKDPRFAVSLSRLLDGVSYTLPANDLRYVLLIPLAVLRKEEMPQNPR